MSPSIKYFTPKQVAMKLQVHLATVHRWIASGKLKAYKRCGSRYLIAEEDMMAALEPVQGEPVRLDPTMEREHRAAVEELRRKGIKV